MNSSVRMRCKKINILSSCLLYIVRTDARWFTRAEILNILGLPNHNVLTQKEYKKFDEEEQKRTMTAPKQGDANVKDAEASSSGSSNAALAPVGSSAAAKDEATNPAKKEEEIETPGPYTLQMRFRFCNT